MHKFVGILDNIVYFAWLINLENKAYIFVEEELPQGMRACLVITNQNDLKRRHRHFENIKNLSEVGPGRGRIPRCKQIHQYSFQNVLGRIKFWALPRLIAWG